MGYLDQEICCCQDDSGIFNCCDEKPAEIGEKSNLHVVRINHPCGKIGFVYYCCPKNKMCCEKNRNGHCKCNGDKSPEGKVKEISKEYLEVEVARSQEFSEIEENEKFREEVTMTYYEEEAKIQYGETAIFIAILSTLVVAFFVAYFFDNYVNTVVDEFFEIINQD